MNPQPALEYVENPVSDMPPTYREWVWKNHEMAYANPNEICPYGQPGDLLWVKEKWADVNTEDGPALMYEADLELVNWQDFCVKKGKDYGAGPSMNYDKYPGDYSMWWSDLLRGEPEHKWKAPRSMPKWASRITLKIKDIRVERLQYITTKGIIAEGLWVWVVEFNKFLKYGK